MRYFKEAVPVFYQENKKAISMFRFDVSLFTVHLLDLRLEGSGGD